MAVRQAIPHRRAERGGHDDDAPAGEGVEDTSDAVRLRGEGVVAIWWARRRTYTERLDHNRPETRGREQRHQLAESERRAEQSGNEHHGLSRPRDFDVQPIGWSGRLRVYGSPCQEQQREHPHGDQPFPTNETAAGVGAQWAARYRRSRPSACTMPARPTIKSDMPTDPPSSRAGGTCTSQPAPAISRNRGRRPTPV